MSIPRFFLLTGLFLLSISSLAQNSKKTETIVDSTKAIPELIEPAEFTNELPDATMKVNSIHSSIIPDSVLLKNKSVLDTFMFHFEEFKKEVSIVDTNMQVDTRLDNLRYYWDDKKAELTSIQNEFNNIKKNLADQKKSLDEIHLKWENSLKATTKDEVPESTTKLVNSFLENIQAIEDTINLKNEFVYKQLELITNTTISINENIKIIEDQKGKVTERQLLTKGPSLFKSLISKNDKNLMQGKRVNSFADISIPILRYISDNKNLIILFVIGFFLLFGFLVFLKKKLSFDRYRKMDLRIIHGALSVLNRPFISSLLITLLFATFLIIDAPQVFNTLLYILLVIPVMVILPAITIKKLDIYIYGLGFLYLLTLFLRLSLLSYNTSHLLMIGIDLISLYGVYQILKNKILDKILYRKTSHFIIKFLFTSFALALIVSIISILFGYYKLGIFLLDSAIWSIYRFFLFYAAYVVLVGFTELLIRSDLMQQFNSVKKNFKTIQQWLDSIIYLFIMITLIYDILVIFKVEEPVVSFFISVWESELNIGEVTISFGNVFTFFITLWVASVFSKLISSIFEYDVSKKLKLKRGVPKTISVMLKYGVLTIGFMIAVAAAGMELKNLTLVISALGVGIGFGLQDVINNFISGLILLFERPIQHGDTVQVGALWGKVKKIGIRSSVIVTFEGSEVIVPNGMLISQEVTNWTLSDNRRRLDVEVGVEYGSNLEQVIDILVKCASSHKEVMEDPAPSAWFTGFGDSSINFKLVFWYPSFDGGLTVKSEVALAVDNALKEAGITIPFPQQDVYVKEFKGSTPVKPEVKKPAIKNSSVGIKKKEAASQKSEEQKKEEVKKPAEKEDKSSPPEK